MNEPTQGYYINKEEVEALKQELVTVTAERDKLKQYAEVCRQDAERWREHAQAFAKERDRLKAYFENP